MSKAAIVLVLTAFTALAQKPDPLEGLWQGYDGEWGHVSRQLIALAEAIPAEKYSWRPAPGVRSTSEVFMHVALGNFYLLSVTGPKLPPDMKPDTDLEKTVTASPKSSPGSSARWKPSAPPTPASSPPTSPAR